MLSNEFINHLEDQLGQKVKDYRSVTGGDISLAFQLQTESNTLFLKVNDSEAFKMFQLEEIGLKTIRESLTINTPLVQFSGKYKMYSYLLMDWVDSKTPSNNDMKVFGTQLAKMHLKTNVEFGFSSNNYIGSLPQSNKEHSTWLVFYIEERLNPQLQFSVDKGLLHRKEVPTAKKMKESCTHIFQNIKPSLLHGDLWGGNFLISTGGIPYLIDPSTYFGHAEIDIAMSKLFGGFGSSFYESYHKIIPQDHYTSTRIELYQLYYLLVHLNLFGNSYYRSVKHILTKYF